MNTRNLYLFVGLSVAVAMMIGCPPQDPDTADPFSFSFDGVLADVDDPDPVIGTASASLDYTGAFPLSGKARCIDDAQQISMNAGESLSILWEPEPGADLQVATLIAEEFPVANVGDIYIEQETMADDIVVGVALDTDIANEDAPGVAFFGEVVMYGGELVIMLHCFSGADGGNSSTITYDEYGAIGDATSGSSAGFADNGYEDDCYSSSKGEPNLVYRDNLLDELKFRGVVANDIMHLIVRD